jgi:hypothetical protein
MKRKHFIDKNYRKFIMETYPKTAKTVIRVSLNFLEFL